MKKVYLYKNITFLKERKKVSQRKMALDLQVNRSTLKNWESNESSPDVYDIARLMEYFGVEDEDIIYTDLEEKYKENQKLLSLKTFLVENELADKNDDVNMKDYYYITSFIYNSYTEAKAKEKEEN